MKKTKINKVFTILLSSLSISSCEKTNFDISLYIYNSSDTFINSLQKELEKSMTEKKYSFKTYDAELSQIHQTEEINNTIEKNSSKLLLVNLVDRLSSSAIIEKACLKNMPIIFFNREPLTSDMIKGRDVNEKLFYVGTDPTIEGTAQTKMLENLFGDPKNLSKEYDKNGDGKIQAVFLKGEIGHQDTERRSKAVINQFNEDGYQIEVLKSSYCNWSRSTAYENFQDIAKDYIDDIEVVISNNDDMAIGAIEYLLEQKIFDIENDKQPFPIVGVDGTEIGLSYVKNGLLYGTVKNNETQQAEAIMTLTKWIFENKKIDSSFPFETSDGFSFYVEGKGITKDDFKID